ncbi:MAG: hypothetical protein ABSH20_10370 [Tepidisphaeraceae bacterium]|jgi:hypothetical protein
MGTFHVDCELENILNRRKHAVVQKMLVDTGSDHSWIPAATLERLGVAREKKEGFNATVDTKRRKLVAAGPMPVAAAQRGQCPPCSEMNDAV